MAESLAFRRAVFMLRQYMVKHPQMRISPEREYVLRAVTDFKEAFTIADLTEKLDGGEMRISKASLYNHMILFATVNIIHRLDRQFGQNRTLYEVTLGKPESMRLICSRCGRVSPFRDIGVHRILKERKYSNFEPETYSVYVFGTCKQCRRKKQETSKG